MIPIKEASELRTFLRLNDRATKVALVPTMGNLHEGHLQLVRKARQLADTVVVSIFVNPLQFAPNEDFAVYPRTLENDVEKLKLLDVACIFAPSTEAMYPTLENHTKVCVPKISDEYCGRFRPPFFYGITTIVAKLFNIVQPDYAIFGEKDFQQLFIIKKMVSDLSFPIEIIPMPTLREPDGLAMSSRNQYLNEEERSVAATLYTTLRQLHDALLLSQDKGYEHLIHRAKQDLKNKGFEVDYLHICNRNTLDIASSQDKELVILVAAWLGKTRLIDNVSICLK